MDYFCSALIRWRCYFVLALVSLSPFACYAVGDFPTASRSLWGVSYVDSQCESDSPSGTAACQMAQWNASAQQIIISGPSCVLTSPTSARCTWKYNRKHDDGGWVYVEHQEMSSSPIRKRVYDACPDTTIPMTGNPGHCTCPAGELVNDTNTGCRVDCKARVSKFVANAGGTGQWQLPALATGQINTGGVCADGCEASFGFRALGYDGKTYGSQMYATGSKCVPGEGGAGAPVPGDAPTSGSETPNSCKAPLCPGQVNGATVCVPCSSTSQEKTETTNPDGTKVETKTECSGGLCTTTETTKDAAGVEKGKTVTIEPLGSICSRFPNSGHCTGLTNNGSGGPAGGSGGSGSGSGNGSGGEEVASSFGGTCAQRFVCTGDAIQCAIAQDQHIRACQFFEDKTPLSVLGEAAANGQAIPEGHPGKNPEVKDFGLSGLINQDGNGLSGGCPADVSISVLGRPAVIPLSTTCDALHMVGRIAVAIALLAAAFIVFKS